MIQPLAPLDTLPVGISAGGSSAFLSGSGTLIQWGSSYSISNYGDITYRDQLVRWRPGSGWQVAAGLLGGSRWWLSDSSFNGDAVVGWYVTSDSRTRAVRSTATGGAVSLGVLPGDDSTRAETVSGNGAVVFGQADRNTEFGVVNSVFRWTQGRGMERIPLPDWRGASFVATNSDGSLAAGVYSERVPYPTHEDRAFVWAGSPQQPVTSGTYEQLPMLPGIGQARSSVNGINDAGTVVLGTCSVFGAYDWHGVAWIQDAETGGWTVRELVPASTWMGFNPLCASSDGQVIGGVLGWEAGVWTPRFGAVSLRDALSYMGMSLNGFHFSSVTWVSPDGTELVGTGNGPGGAMAWRISGLNLAYIPAPSATWILMGGAAIALRRRR